MMKPYPAGSYDIAVIGAGHAGIEAALAAARLGCRTIIFTISLDAIGNMPCNPSIGGTGKGHLVYEIDALGGEMGRAIDDVFIQSRMLNTGKGPAVHSLRAQADKAAYKKRMLNAILSQENLEIRQAEVCDVVEDHGRVCAVKTTTGETIPCRAAVLSTGVYLKSRIIIGQCSMILATSKQPENAWKFLDWWTSVDVQAKNAQEYEMTMGSAYRYTTANVEAMKSLSWTKAELATILDVWETTRGIPEVPGGYYIGRSMDNALRNVLTYGNDAQEVLKEYVGDINREIQIKRREFGLE